MDIKRLTLMTMLAGLILLMSTSSNEPDILYWSDIKQLKWTDFQGHPRYDYDQISALTSSGIVDYKGCKDGKINYKVRAYFEKKNSWVKSEAYTDYHLAHEQLHFDITELYARRLRMLLDKRDFKCGEEAEFDKFIEMNLDSWHTDQKNYDIITKHSIDQLKQKEWTYRIQMELSLLNEYKDD